MAKLPPKRQADIKLENLLRLKRFERPSDQFWNEFDRELHQRMLQTLVKKDPWYLQVMHVFSGRILQSTAIAVAAVLVAMIVVRPAFQSTKLPIAVAQAPADDEFNASIAIAMTELTLAEATSLPNYDSDVISAEATSDEVNFVRDFGMEQMRVASYDATAYSTDSAQARVAFASAGVASLVY